MTATALRREIYGPVGGNVVTNDVEGADTAEVMAVTGTVTTGSGDFNVEGQYGVLALNADGSYTYTRNADAPGGVTDTFTYTLTDTDGDADTAVLSIALATTRRLWLMYRPGRSGHLGR